MIRTIIEKIRRRYYLAMILAMIFTGSIAQTVATGINYQAVARDNNGRELAGKEIDVQFSIISGSPLGTVVYKELHANITTSKYGVFSLIIGNGIRVEGTVSSFDQIAWEQANHYLKVEVKFDNNFIDMGTMQFLAVPYALYAKKSLEPGPQGPKGDQGLQGLKGDQGAKGDPGDPATDNQSLSFDGNNLSITGGNTVPLSSLNVPHVLTVDGNKLSILGGNNVELPNQIQDLQLDVNNKLKITNNAAASEINLAPFRQDLSLNSGTGLLSISNGTGVDLTPIKNDAIQDLTLDVNNKLKITKNPLASEIDLGVFKQNLNYNNTTGILSISNGTGADLSVLKTDEIQDITLTGNHLSIDKNPLSLGVELGKYLDDKDEQTLSYDSLNYSLSVSGGNSVKMGRIIAFRAEKTNPAGPTGSEVPLVFDVVRYNDGTGYNSTTGEFVAPINGIYTFNVRYDAELGAKISIYLNGQVYERIADAISNSGAVYRSITMKLSINNVVKVIVHTGVATQTGTGSFSGFRVY